jgi:hypothetical protein
MSQCKCGKEGCDGTVCMCGTTCGCDTTDKLFEEVLKKKEDMKENINFNQDTKVRHEELISHDKPVTSEYIVPKP